MRISLTVIAILACCATLVGQSSEKKLQTIIANLNNDNRDDTIFIYSSLKDARLFHKVMIAISGFERQSFRAKSEWAFVDSGFLAHNKNFVNSGKVFVQKARDHSIILLFGVVDAAGYRGDFSIINIKKDKAVMVFDKKDEDVEIPITLTDIDNDGRTEFIFRNFGELYQQVDSLNADVGTYNPFLVYTIDDDCRLNKLLTKNYNQEHYVFAGYQYSEKIKILYPRDKRKQE